LLALGCPALAAPSTVDFEPGFILLTPGDTYAEKGVRFTPGGGDAIIDVSFCDPNSEFCAVGNSTSFLSALNDAVLDMRADFILNLLSFDAAFFPSPFIDFSGEDVRLQVDGVTVGGQTVSQDFPLLEDGASGNFLFSTYQAPAAFGALQSVSFSVCFQHGNACDRPSGQFLNDAQFALDNIVFDVPEPMPAVLLAISLAALATVRSRKTR